MWSGTGQARWTPISENVFRVPVDGGNVTRLDDSLLRDIVPVDQRWPSEIPKPFPISFRDGNGMTAPSLFLAQRPAASSPAPAPLWVSTIFRGVFVRGD